MLAAKEAVSIEKLMKLRALKLSPELGVHLPSDPDSVMGSFKIYPMKYPLPPMLMLFILNTRYLLCFCCWTVMEISLVYLVFYRKIAR